MDVPLDEVIYVEAVASSSTGAAADADSTPTFAVYEEATDTDIGVGGNMTKRTSLTGDYRASFTASAANGFELGKWYAVIGSATVGGVAAKGVLMRFRIVAAEGVAGYPYVDVKKVAGTDQTARDLGASVLVGDKTGFSLTQSFPSNFASLSITAGGVAKADLDTIKTQAVTCGAGVTVLASVGTAAASTAQTGDNFARIGLAGAGLTALGDTRLANLDATVSSRTKPADTQAAVTLVVTTTNLTNAPPDSSGVTTLLSRLGAFTGSGVNTVLGFFKALLSKTASTPSDVGGTFDPATDSTEAIRDRGDAAWVTATGFSTHTAADVWGVATRTITGGTVSTLTTLPAVTTDWLTAAGVSAAAANKLADHSRRRTQANVFASTDGDAVSKNSEYGHIQMAQKSSVSGTTMTVLNTDGTTLGTFTLTASASADPITGVS